MTDEQRIEDMANRSFISSFGWLCTWFQPHDDREFWEKHKLEISFALTRRVKKQKADE